MAKQTKKKSPQGPKRKVQPNFTKAGISKNGKQKFGCGGKTK